MEAVKKFVKTLTQLLERLPARQVDLAIALLVTLAGLAIYAFVEAGGSRRAGFSFIQNVELRSLDARFKMRGPRPVDSRVAIVGIDEKTLQRVGSYPIARSAYARMIDRLAAGGARVIAFDITFPTPEKNSAVEALKKLETEISGAASAAVIEQVRQIERSSDNDRIFAQSMQPAGNVVLGHIFLDAERAKSMDAKAAEDYFNILWGKPFPQMLKVKGGRDFDLGRAWADPTRGGGQVYYGIEANIRLLAEAARSYGFFNDDPDNDGTFRRAALIARYADRDFFPSLAFQTVREYENIKDQSIAGFMSENGLERIEFGPHRLNTRRDGTVLINYAGPYRTYPQYSMADVLDGTAPPETFKNKIVLVGGTALGIGDLRVTPYQSSDYMGVEIHANVVDNLLHSGEKGRSFLSRGFNEEMIDVFFILLFGLALGYWFGRTRPMLATASVLAALAVFAFIVQFAFSRLGMWLSFVIPAGTLLANYASITSFRMIFEEREKRKVRRNFATYVSPGVIGLIEKDPRKYFRPGGETKELTVMFTDIRSFTTISEGMTADELVLLLNEYLGEMTEILFYHWGTLDKYIGDAIMAFWGSPFPQQDHATRACLCALHMMARLDELNLKWELEGRKQLAIGIGINTGLLNVGNMGSSKRMAWTVMGDNVNLASRLEGLTKEYHARMVVAEGTYAQAKEQFVFRELDRIRVKGKLQPVNIYELLGPASDASSYADLLARFSDALVAYRRQRWDEAIEKFETLLSRYPDDGAAHVFLKRSHEFMQEAPAPQWDGVYVFKTK